MSAYPDDRHRLTGYPGCGRRTPSSQGNGSHRAFFSLPPFASGFRSSRPRAEHYYSHNQNQLQAEWRNEYNEPLNDPSSTWSNYSATLPDDDDPRLQHSYPASQQLPQHYQSSRYRDPSTSYSNHPTTLPPVSASHPRDNRWQQNPYGGSTTTNHVPETVFSTVASYPTTSPQYLPQDPPQGTLSDTHFFLPTATSTSPSTATVRRGPVSVERTATRNPAHTASPYSRDPLASGIFTDHPPPKKKRKRVDAEQLRVLNEVYVRTAFPSTEERQELAIRLNMTPRSVQIWFQNKRQSVRNAHRQLGSFRGPGLDNPPGVHHSGSSRTTFLPWGVPTVPMPPHQPNSVSLNHHQAVYIPPHTIDAAYFALSHAPQPQQGASGHYRPPSLNTGSYDDYHR